MGKKGLWRQPHLPLANAFYRVEQHEDVEQQAVADPKGEDEFGEEEEEEGAPPAKPLRQDKAHAAQPNIGQGVDHGVAVVAEGEGGFAVAVDDKGGVFDDFPDGFDGDGDEQTPGKGNFGEEPSQNPEEGETVQEVGKAVGVKKVLGVVGAPDVARPEPDLAAAADPQAALLVELEGGEEENGR